MTQLFEIRLNCDDYPALLKQIDTPPKILYGIGNKALLSEPSLAIVGSRQATQYGKKWTRLIATELAQFGFGITSGLAYGVDSWAHEAVADQGRAIGVIAGGITAPLLSWQKNIAKKILHNDGVIISEYPGTTPALKHHFPLRNRIIAGLSYGALIIEARQKSGALITAKLAAEFGRTVFVVPGDLDRPTSLGGLELIKRGAHPISSALDIKKELQAQLPLKFVKRQAETISEQILTLLGKQTSDAQGLSIQMNQPLAEVLTGLTKLELAGQIVHLENNSYALKI